MSFAPKHRILVDDVVPVELVNGANDGMNEARSIFGHEHYTEGMQTGRHRVFTIPHASAILQFPGTADAAIDNGGSVSVTAAWGRWGQLPTWEPSDLTIHFSVRAARHICGIGTSVQATSQACAFGIPHARKDTPTQGLLEFLGDSYLDGLTLVYLEVYAIV